jgi:hypothetical protein
MDVLSGQVLRAVTPPQGGRRDHVDVIPGPLGSLLLLYQRGSVVCVRADGQMGAMLCLGDAFSVFDIGVTCEDEVVVCLCPEYAMPALEIVWFTMTGDAEPTLVELRRVHIPTQWVREMLRGVDLGNPETLAHVRLSMMPDRCLVLTLAFEAPWMAAAGGSWTVTWDDDGARVLGVLGQCMRFYPDSTAFFPFQFVPLADGRLLASPPPWYPPQIRVMLA